MSKKTLYNSDFYQIEADYKAKLIKAKWHRSVSRVEVETGGTKLYESLRDTKMERVIADLRSLSGLDADTKEWMATNFYELLSRTQLRKLARILPDNLFHQISLESVVTRAEALGITKFEVKNFKDVEIAMKWLDE